MLAKALTRAKLVFTHVPNEGKRTERQGASLKEQGLQPGFPDYLIFTPIPNAPELPGCAIELKRTKGGTTSATQKHWLAKLENLGWATYVAKGWRDGVRWLRDEMGYDFS